MESDNGQQTNRLVTNAEHVYDSVSSVSVHHCHHSTPSILIRTLRREERREERRSQGENEKVN